MMEREREKKKKYFIIFVGIKNYSMVLWCFGFLCVLWFCGFWVFELVGLFNWDFESSCGSMGYL